MPAGAPTLPPLNAAGIPQTADYRPDSILSPHRTAGYPADNGDDFSPPYVGVARSSSAAHRQTSSVTIGVSDNPVHVTLR